MGCSASNPRVPIPDWLAQEVWRREEICKQIGKVKLDKVKDVRMLWLEEEERRFKYFKEIDGASVRGYFTITEVNQNDFTFVGLWEKPIAPGNKAAIKNRPKPTRVNFRLEYGFKWAYGEIIRLHMTVPREGTVTFWDNETAKEATMATDSRVGWYEQMEKEKLAREKLALIKEAVGELKQEKKDEYGSVTSKLQELAQMKKDGLLSDEEFQLAKDDLFGKKSQSTAAGSGSDGAPPPYDSNPPPPPYTP